jgi:hypothetical protein
MLHGSPDSRSWICGSSLARTISSTSGMPSNHNKTLGVQSVHEVGIGTPILLPLRW